MEKRGRAGVVMMTAKTLAAFDGLRGQCLRWFHGFAILYLLREFHNRRGEMRKIMEKKLAWLCSFLKGMGRTHTSNTNMF